jgi:DNA-binding CsgD family transcriptional regulator
MFIARGTVKTHLAHIFAKLTISSRSELAAEATQRGLGATAATSAAKR